MKDQNVPFGLYPVLIFGNLEDALFRSLCPYSLHVSGRIIVDDSGDLRGLADIFLRRKPTESSS